jgi:hypothetical protein
MEEYRNKSFLFVLKEETRSTQSTTIIGSSMYSEYNSHHFLIFVLQYSSYCNTPLEVQQSSYSKWLLGVLRVLQRILPLVLEVQQSLFLTTILEVKQSLFSTSLLGVLQQKLPLVLKEVQQSSYSKWLRGILRILQQSLPFLSIVLGSTRCTRSTPK